MRENWPWQALRTPDQAFRKYASGYPLGSRGDRPTNQRAKQQTMQRLTKTEAHYRPPSVDKNSPESPQNLPPKWIPHEGILRSLRQQAFGNTKGYLRTDSRVLQQTEGLLHCHDFIDFHCSSMILMFSI